MKLIAPDYYKEFLCIADNCLHNCCIGWEIDIDKESYEYYSSVKGEFGLKLMSGISSKGEIPHFVLGDNERCPFLNEGNLCDIIINLGEERLCQICSDHPRFRNFYCDRTEIGVGMSCESAAKLILTKEEKVKLITIDDDGFRDETDGIEERFFKLRKEIFKMIQNRRKSIDERIQDLADRLAFNLPKIGREKWYEIYMGMERLDSAWTDNLRLLKPNGELPYGKEWNTAFEQLIVYFLYRHMADGIYDGTLTARIAFAIHAYRIIRFICEGYMTENGKITIRDLTEFARMYSAEIEYSEDNMNALLELLSRHQNLPNEALKK